MANEFIARNGLISQNNSTVTGSLTVTQGITGSLFGTASYATTASFVPGKERRNANNSTNNNINYCGSAPSGSSEASSVWNIKKLLISSSGAITTTSATSVAWTNRESATYI